MSLPRHEIERKTLDAVAEERDFDDLRIPDTYLRLFLRPEVGDEKRDVRVIALFRPVDASILIRVSPAHADRAVAHLPERRPLLGNDRNEHGAGKVPDGKPFFIRL